MKRYALVLASALFLSACAGTNFSFENARKVQVGMTESEVIGIMGKPFMVTTRGDKVIWVWSHANAFSGAKSVSFVFKDGVVDNVPNLPKTFE